MARSIRHSAPDKTIRRFANQFQDVFYFLISTASRLCHFFTFSIMSPVYLAVHALISPTLTGTDPFTLS